MSKEIITGDEAAQPCIESINHNGIVEISTSESGLTIRQHFAGLALQGYLAGRNGNISAPDAQNVANMCVGYADALIKELNKQYQ